MFQELKGINIPAINAIPNKIAGLMKRSPASIIIFLDEWRICFLNDSHKRPSARTRTKKRMRNLLYFGKKKASAKVTISAAAL